MKIDRVIFCLDNNPSYCYFWNNYAYIWKKYYGIQPTLFFLGEENELKNSIDVTVGDVFRLDYIQEISDPAPNWLVTWSLFWGASQFGEETCFLSGVDQIPISDYYLKKSTPINQDDYVIFFADAYENYNQDTLGYWNTVTNVMYPSSHHISKGKNFKDIYRIEKKWKDEAFKVFESRSKFHLNNHYYPNSKLWGLDECYSSWMLSEFKHQSIIKYLNEFKNNHNPRRLELDIISNLDNINFKDYLEITFKNPSHQNTCFSLVDRIYSE